MSEWTPERIVRVREVAAGGYVNVCVMESALDEIERLRARVAELEEREQHRERLLREAKKAIKAGLVVASTRQTDNGPVGQARRMLREAFDRIRAELDPPAEVEHVE